VVVAFQLNWLTIRRAEVDAAQGLLGSNDLSARRPVLSMKVLAAMRRFVTPALA